MRSGEYGNFSGLSATEINHVSAVILTKFIKNNFSILTFQERKIHVILSLEPALLNDEA